MWAVFLSVVLILSFVGLFLWWLGSQVLLSIRRSEREFEQEESELKNQQEKKENHHE